MLLGARNLIDKKLQIVNYVIKLKTNNKKVMIDALSINYIFLNIRHTRFFRYILKNLAFEKLQKQ